MQQTTMTPMEALAQLIAAASVIDTAECKDEGIYNRLQSAVATAGHVFNQELAVLAMAPKQEAKHGCFIDLADDEEPDGCVVDTGRFNDCLYARQHGEKARNFCGEWKPIKIIAPAVANGAMPDEQILLHAAPVFGEQDDRNVRNDELIAFARAILAAAGPDAALPAGHMPPEQSEMVAASLALSPWLAAAIDDPDVCEAYKTAINNWFNAAMPSATIDAFHARILDTNHILESQLECASDVTDTALAKDAERYRWLRDPDTDVSLVLDKAVGFVPPDENFPGVGGYNMYEYRAGEELDKAIDAALSGAKGN